MSCGRGPLASHQCGPGPNFSHQRPGISAMSVTFNLLLTIINKKLSFSGDYKIRKPLTWDEGLVLTLVNLMGKALKRAACKVCALWPISFVLLRVQWRFFFCLFVFRHVKGAFVTFGTLYRKIARVLLPVNFFSLTTGYIPGVVVAH